MTFASLHLMPQLLQAVTKSGYASPTPIQAATIPLVLAGKDVLGCAQTGTGKTAAFALPILQNLSRRPVRPGAPRPIRALMLTPTRELAQQIQDNFVAYGKQLALFSCVLFGGVNQNAQVEALHRGADIVVACPGRLMDLMNQGYVCLDYVETFVLDEADRMLDMGFIHDVRRIAAKLPPRHQTLLFSATMPPEVETLAMQLLHAPETVKVDLVSSPVEAIEQTPWCSPAPGTVRTASSGTWTGRASLPPPFTGTKAKTPGKPPWTASSAARARCWWPRTLPPGASTLPG